jgi:hypothetical protein
VNLALNRNSSRIVPKLEEVEEQRAELAVIPSSAQSASAAELQGINAEAVAEAAAAAGVNERVDISKSIISGKLDDNGSSSEESRGLPSSLQLNGDKRRLGGVSRGELARGH